jgi:hypothetical protein
VHTCASAKGRSLKGRVRAWAPNDTSQPPSRAPRRAAAPDTAPRATLPDAAPPHAAPPHATPRRATPPLQLPDGTELNIGPDRFRVPETLFNAVSQRRRLRAGGAAGGGGGACSRGSDKGGVARQAPAGGHPLDCPTDATTPHTHSSSIKGLGDEP